RALLDRFRRNGIQPARGGVRSARPSCARVDSRLGRCALGRLRHDPAFVVAGRAKPACTSLGAADGPCTLGRVPMVAAWRDAGERRLVPGSRDPDCGARMATAAWPPGQASGRHAHSTIALVAWFGFGVLCTRAHACARRAFEGCEYAARHVGRADVALARPGNATAFE